MKNQKNITPSQIVGYEVDQIEDELYDCAQDLGIIKNFDKNDFKKRFFYLFIERNHRLVSEYGFIENLFEEAEKGEGESKNFPLHMKQMFLYIFSSLSQNRSKRIDLDFIENLYSLTKNSIRDKNVATIRKIDAFVKSGLSTKDLSENSLKRIFDMANNSETGVNYELLPQKKAGTYVAKLRGNTLELDLCHSIISEEEVRQTMSELLETYYDRMSELKKQTAGDDDKIKLIGTVCSDIMKLHPFKNGNGRTFCFGLLNHLLIQEGLEPCMIFNPWHIAHASPEDRFAAIKEGQMAFQQYFINGAEIERNPDDGKIIPLTSEVQKMSTLKEEAAKIPLEAIHQNLINEIPNLLFLYLQIKTFDECNLDASKIRNKLGDKIEELKKDGQLALMKQIAPVQPEFDEVEDLYESLFLSSNNVLDENFNFNKERNKKITPDQNIKNIYENNFDELMLKFSVEVGGEEFVEFRYKNLVSFIEKDCAEILKPKNVTKNNSASQLNPAKQNTKS